MVVAAAIEAQSQSMSSFFFENFFLLISKNDGAVRASPYLIDTVTEHELLGKHILAEPETGAIDVAQIIYMIDI